MVEFSSLFILDRVCSFVVCKNLLTKPIHSKIRFNQVNVKIIFPNAIFIAKDAYSIFQLLSQGMLYTLPVPLPWHDVIKLIFRLDSHSHQYEK